MSIPRYTALAARLLRENLQDVRFRGSAGERQRSLQTIERALNAAQRRRWYRRAAGAALAVAASLALWFSFEQLSTFSAGNSARRPEGAHEVSVRALPLGSGATVVSASGEVALLPGTQLAVGDRVATEQHGGAVLSLSTGTHLELGADSNFVVQSENQVQRFSLDRGSLQANVATLHQGQRFVVDTPEAQVEVRGTEFRLRLLEAAAVCVPAAETAELAEGSSAAESAAVPSRVRLWVREGVVEVRSRGTVTRVGAGEAWPSDCVDEEAHLEQGTALRQRAANGLHGENHRVAEAVELGAGEPGAALDVGATERGAAEPGAVDELGAAEPGGVEGLNGAEQYEGALRRAEGQGTAENYGVAEGSEEANFGTAEDARFDQTKLGQTQQRAVRRGSTESELWGAEPTNGATGQGEQGQRAARRGETKIAARGSSAQPELAQRELGSSASTSRPSPPKGVRSPAAHRAEGEAEQDAAALARNAASRSEGKGEKAADRGSALAAQTRLFAQGVQSRQQGDSASALTAFQELLTRYPDSALAENAIVERMRLLQARDPAAARREAERYLQRYPRGFARREAEPIAAKR